MNEDKSQTREQGRHVRSGSLSRREFLQITGGGIIVFFTVGNAPATVGVRKSRTRPDANAYVRIGDDGRVTCFTGKVELGQGVMTSLAQMLAEELSVPMEAIDMVMGDTDLCPFDPGTWGSMTTPYTGPVLRAAGAEARAILVELAAEHLEVPKDRLDVLDGVVFDKTRKDRKVTYAQLAKGKQIERQLEHEPDVKEVSEFKVIGKSHPRLDTLDKVTGKAQYTGDIRIPGMVCAKILRPPAHGAELKSLDTSGAEQIEGAQVIRDDDLIAVLHEIPDVAEKALAAIKAEWDIPEPRFDDKTVFDYFLENAAEGKVEAEEGNLEEGEKESSTVVEETYLDGYVSHAPIEPHTALAQFEGDKLTVWASTQTPFGCKKQLSEQLGIPAENVRVIAPFVGGGFGGKISSTQAIEAARLARLAGKPVQVAWTRAEEFFCDTFRPAAVVKIKSGISNSGKTVLWDYHIYGAGDRGADVFYAIPNHRIVVRRELKNGEEMHPFATGPWRAPHNSTNSFARESHIDTLAAAAGMDPLDFRLKNITNDRMIRVLKAAADQFGWTPGKPPSGRGVGIACGTDVDAYVALMAEVKVDERSGKVQVKRVVCAQDAGVVINPDGAKNQIEGCITMGLGYALAEEVRFNGGRVIDKNFTTYKLPRFSWVPEIESVLVEPDGIPPKGGGEPAIIVVGGVIANAIHDAIGARVFTMPMTPDRVMEAIAKRRRLLNSV